MATQLVRYPMAAETRIGWRMAVTQEGTEIPHHCSRTNPGIMRSARKLTGLQRSSHAVKARCSRGQSGEQTVRHWLNVVEKSDMVDNFCGMRREGGGKGERGEGDYSFRWGFKACVGSFNCSF